MGTGRIFHFLYRTKTAGGIEVIPTGGGYRFIVTILKKKKQDLIMDQYEITEIENLKELPDLPYSLSLSSKFIKRECLNEHMGALLKEPLPGANPDDFLFQVSPISTDCSVVNIVRKELVLNIIKLFYDSRKTVVSFSLGSSIPDESNFQSQQIKFNRDEFDSKFQSSFSNALSLLNSDSLTNGIVLDELNHNRSELKNKRLFELGGIILLVFFFLILQANSLVFQNLSDQQNKHVELNRSIEDLNSRFKILKKEKDRKISFLKGNGFLDQTKTSYYADEIGSSLPSSIRLIFLEINPCVKKNGEEKIDFIDDKIVITGTCIKSVDLNLWINKVREMKWVKQVTLQDYKLNSEIGKREFTMNISI